MARSWRSRAAGDRAPLQSEPATLPSQSLSSSVTAAAGAAETGSTAFTKVAANHPRLILVLLCLALWLPGFFNLPPTDRDESRFAQATKQMLETGDFVRIMNGAEPRNRKPIGIYWLQAPFAAAARATGIAAANPIWPYRLPSLLGGIAAVLATYSLGQTLLTGRRYPFLAAAMLASCVILTVEAHIAKTDAALLGATTIAMAVLARAWTRMPQRSAEAALFWIALGAGILIKGPITPMVTGATALAGSLWLRSPRWLAALRPAWGLPLTAAIILPWFVAIGLATHGRFFSDAVGGDLAAKMTGGSESHGAPPGLHLLLLPLLTFPATIPVIAGFACAWRCRRLPEIAFLLCWLLPSWLIFEAVPTKLPHYTLPLYPALFLLAAAGLRTQPAPYWLRLAATTLATLVALVIGLGALALPIMLHASPWLGVPALLSATLVLWFAARGRLPAAILAGVALYASVLQLALPALHQLWLAPSLTAVVRADAPGVGADGNGLVTAGYDEPSLMFLAGTRLAAMPNGDAAARELARLGHGAAIVAAPDLPDFTAGLARRGWTAVPIGQVDGVNTARGKTMQFDIEKLEAQQSKTK
jgi:4-amino-4-deoxy-L-arabinose transferase-like glycosyltransferase